MSACYSAESSRSLRKMSLPLGLRQIQCSFADKAISESRGEGSGQLTRPARIAQILPAKLFPAIYREEDTNIPLPPLCRACFRPNAVCEIRKAPRRSERF